MTEYVYHEGFRIHAAPHQLADSGEWTLNIYIELDKLSKIVSRHFFASDSFKSREEAIVHCFNFLESGSSTARSRACPFRIWAGECDKDATKV